MFKVAKIQNKPYLGLTNTQKPFSRVEKQNDINGDIAKKLEGVDEATFKGT